METAAPFHSDNSRPTRARSWTLKTVLVHCFSFLLYPAFICGCHFSLIGLIFTFVPIGWGFYLLASYETRSERFTAYIATALSIAWIYLSWESNLQFIRK